jgi:hypothetical protein
VRPGEALALTFGDVRQRTILVERSVSLGEVKETKTGRLHSVRLLPPLADDLSAWRTACGATSDDALVFPSSSGSLWTGHDWKNWVRRRFRPAAAAAGVEGARPYDLRHSFCSLLLYEGRTIVEVARQAGHAPSMSLDTYQHVIDELDGAERIPAEEQIRRARANLVPVSYPLGVGRQSGDATKGPNPLLMAASRRPDSNRGPLHYECGLARERRRPTSTVGQCTRRNRVCAAGHAWPPLGGRGGRDIRVLYVGGQAGGWRRAPRSGAPPCPARGVAPTRSSRSVMRGCGDCVQVAVGRGSGVWMRRAACGAETCGYHRLTKL